MKTFISSLMASGRQRLGWMGVWLALSAVPAVAQLDTSLGLWLNLPVKNERGQTLQGNDGAPYELVMVLWASNNWAYPPADVIGNPDPRNPLMESGLAHIGDNVTQQGRFSWTYDEVTNLNPRPKSGRIFMRVFNGPDLGSSSFYGDSEILVVPTNGGVVAGTVYMTSTPLDTDDDDGDGLNNSWEDSEGTSRDDQDTDDDGLDDNQEHLTGTDGTDPDSYFQVVWIRPSGSDAIVAWPSVAGKKYRLQYTEDELSVEAPQYMNVTAEDIEASGAVTEYVVPDGMTLRGFYRVWLVE